MLGGAAPPASGASLCDGRRGLTPDQTATISRRLSQWQADNLPLGAEQKSAIWLALNNAFSVIAGGAGVGKTTILKALYVALEVLGTGVVQMALSGRAAKRMKDATGLPAMTIAGFVHTRTVGGPMGSSGPHFDRQEPDRTVYVVDEASMLSTADLFQILRRIGPGGRLVLMGDPMQLPPIAAGLTFHHLTTSAVPRTHIATVYRQAAATGIPQVAAAIRAGHWPALPRYAGPGEGLSVLPCRLADAGETLARLYRALVDTAGDRAAVQILPALRGNGRTTPLAMADINMALFQREIGDRPPVLLSSGPSAFVEGCPIIVTENQWKRGLVNGAIGLITVAHRSTGRAVDAAHGGQRVVCRATLDGEEFELTEDDITLGRVVRAFAVTIHKAQGSQWPYVILPVERSRLLDRSLVYTAITRGVRQVVLVGDIAAAAEAVAAMPKAFARTHGLAAAMEHVNGEP
nr:AAA family ATPase [Azospirillum brasilense]